VNKAATTNKVETNRMLPKGWRWMKLGEICIQDRQIIESNSAIALKLPYLSLEHVESCSGKILKQSTAVVEDEGTSTTFAFDERHILYGKLRPYLNKVAMPDFHGRCTTELIPLLPSSDIHREYLCWLLRGQDTVNEAMKGKTGSRMPRANMEELLQLLIPLPALPEQKRIAAILNEQMAAVEKARAAAEAELDAAKALPAAYLRSVFNSPEAQKWPRKKLEQIGYFESGGTPSKDNGDYWDGDIPFVTGADITDFYITRKNARAFLSPKGLNSGKTAICDSGTVLFVTRTRVGRVGIASETMGASQDLSPYICGAEILPEYACRYLLSISDCLIVSCRGATIQGLTRDFIRSIEIPLPSIKKQQIITETLNEQIAAVKTIRKTLDEQLETINKLPAALLKRAFKGEL